MSKKKNKTVTKHVVSERRHRNRWFLLLIPVVVTLAFIVYLSFSPQSFHFGQFKDFNILLVTLDTVRADRLPVYGYQHVSTPALDRLAKQGLIFENAISHVPLTLPSHASIFTARLPVGHGVRDNSGYFLDPSEVTLAEVLKQAGYTTAGFVSAFILDRTWQINQGFDYYYDHFNPAEQADMNLRDVQRKADETAVEAKRWLNQNADKKFFAWIHFYDPHDPYTPPEPYRSLYAASPYDGEIAYADHALEQILDRLQQLKLTERTLIVVTGDHGEGLGEHKEPTHGIFLYDTTLHVPLILSSPQIKNRRIAPVVRHIDLAPTILALVGIQPPASMQGQSLLPLINGKEKKGRPAVSESLYAELHYGWSSLTSIRSNQYKYIDAPNAELYDLDKDLLENQNLIYEKQSIARVLKTQLDETIAAASRKDLKGPQPMDPEMEEKLAALGYIGSTATATEETRKIDPKDKIHLANAIQNAAAAAMEENYREALQLLGPVLAEGAAGIEGHLTAGVSYAGIGDFARAIDQFLHALRLRPDSIRAMYNLAYAYQMNNQPKEAEYWFLEVLKRDPGHMPAATKLAALYRILNRPSEAEPLFQRVLTKYHEYLQEARSTKGKAHLYASIAEVQFLAGRFNDAERSLREAIRLLPEAPDFHYNLAQVLEALGHPDQALMAYQEETRVNPSNFKAFYNLGMMYAERKLYDSAAESFRKVIELNPQDGLAYRMLASVYKVQGKEEEADRILSYLQERK